MTTKEYKEGMMKVPEPTKGAYVVINNSPRTQLIALLNSLGVYDSTNWVDVLCKEIRKSVLQEAKECVPEERTVQVDEFDTGFNFCRSLILEAITKLTSHD